jgi:hypothetical protein
MSVDGSAFVSRADALLAQHVETIQLKWATRCRNTMEKAVVIIDPLAVGKDHRALVHMTLMSEREAQQTFRQSVVVITRTVTFQS